jgi:hypothetical protein
VTRNAAHRKVTLCWAHFARAAAFRVACGVRDRRPEGGIVEAACTRHADPTIPAYAACYMCLGARPTIAIDGELLVHKKCHAEDCAA